MVRIKNILHEKKYDIILFASVTIINTLLILQGLDITDTGFHLAYQYFLISDFSSIIQNANATCIFTNFIGGIWLHIFPYPSLIWARIGGILLLSFTSLFTYFTLIRFFEKKESFLAVFASTMLISSLYYLKLIDYYSFPAFLSVLILYFFSRSFFFNQKKISRIDCIIFGILFFLLIISRISALLLIIGLVGYIIIYKFLFNRHFIEKEELIFISIGFLSSFGIFVGLLYGNGQLNNYWIGIEGFFNYIQISSDGHDVNNIWYQISLFKYIFVATLGILLLYFVRKPHKNIKTIYIKSAFLIIFLFFVSIVTKVIFDESNRFFMNEYIFFYSPIWAGVSGFIVASYIIVKYSLKSDEKYIYILEIGIIFTILTPIGSNTELFRVIYGWWLPLSISLLLLPLVSHSFYKDFQKNNNLFLSIIIGILLLSGVIFFVGTYRDSSNRGELLTEFNYPSLQGIYSTSERVKTVDEFLWAINNSSQEGDTIFLSGYSSLYFFANRAPFLGDPWISKRSNETIYWKISHYNKELYYPELYGYSKSSAVWKNWPRTKEQFGTSENNSVLDEIFIKEMKYNKIFENDFFVLYKFSKDKKDNSKNTTFIAYESDFLDN